MIEAQVGFLYNIAAAVSQSETDETKTLLKSYYLMRCKYLTRGYGLPDKYFSLKIRCPKCCIEWKQNTRINVKTIKLTQRQKQRLKSRKVKESRKGHIRGGNDLLRSNEIEQICTFCNQTTITNAVKPLKHAIKTTSTSQFDNSNTIVKENTKINNLQIQDVKNIKSGPTPDHKKKRINVYSNALDVFSLQNADNSLASKEKPKVINNNKRKKDKFAGLCQKAVLASAKLKEKGEKPDKLSLFLKPSS